MSERLPGELIYYAVDLGRELEQVEIYGISDYHLGNPLSSAHHLEQLLSRVRLNPNAFIVLNGDLCECVIPDSKGEIFAQTFSPQEQRDRIIELFHPLKHRVLGMTTGNHEARIAHKTGMDISKDIAHALGCPYRPEGVLLKVSFGDFNKSTKGKPYVYFVYATHGYGGARTKAAKAVKVERLATWIHADAYIMSHDHVVNAAADVYLMPDPRTHIDRDGRRIGRVAECRKMLVKAGAFLKWGGYSEMGGFPPVDLSQPIIKLAGRGRPRVTVEI